MKNWKALKSELLKDKDVAREYKNLTPRFAIVSQIIEARLKRGITQAQLAKKIGTKQSAIARLESGNTNPSLAFLEKLAQAMDYRLKIEIL
ncbi:MAG: helix-turn-helix transcriptional regulator [bacterium]|nr:helix-turn-helix transcriptional regulator [bacterium]